MNLLNEKLQELNINLQFIKKTVNRDDGIEQVQIQITIKKNYTNFQKVSELSKLIEEKFQELRFISTDKLKFQKLQKDFKYKMSQYSYFLESYHERKQSQLDSLRNSYHPKQKNSEKKRNKRPRGSSSEEDEKPKQIQLQTVNHETVFQERMIELKEKELLEIKKKMEEALSVQKQVDKLIKEQGEQLDIVQQNVDSARSNVKQGGQLLQQGVRHHISANKKKFCIMGIIFVLLLIIIIPIMIKVL